MTGDPSGCEVAQEMPRKNLFDELLEAITFAEAGELGTAQAIASEIFSETSQGAKGRILAVSRGPGFTPAMVEKALGLASRLDCGLVALSVPPSGTRLAGLLRRHQRRRAPSECSAEVFRARAAARRVPFAHAVQPGDPEEVVTEVSRRLRRVAFLLIDAAQLPGARFGSVRVPIFSVADE